MWRVRGVLGVCCGTICGKINMEAQGDSILLYYSGNLRVPDDVELLIRRALQFLELIRHYLIEQAKGANSSARVCFHCLCLV